MEITRIARVVDVLEWMILTSVVSYGLYVFYKINKEK